MAYDLLIRNGLLIDGTGGPGVIGDLAVADGRIAAIGPRLTDRVRRVIDAGGLAVAPGFIDIKTHSDFVLPINPKAESKVRQGVTTEIIGPRLISCGQVGAIQIGAAHDRFRTV